MLIEIICQLGLIKITSRSRKESMSSYETHPADCVLFMLLFDAPKCKAGYILAFFS